MNLLNNWEKNQKPCNLKFKKDFVSGKRSKWLFAESEKKFQGKKCLTYQIIKAVFQMSQTNAWYYKNL